MVARNSVKNALQDISASSHVGFGCSGGADSLALMFSLATLYKKDRAKLVHVIIVDHQLQDITAEISQKTADLAESLGFNAHIIPIEIVSTKEGMESDARKARYEAFENAIGEYNLESFLIGHTKTDQAEQVFLGMLRGSGTKSLSGIPQKRGIFVRPFLNSLSREDTQKVCEENNYDYWCDPHNDSTEYRRVIVRKMIKDVQKETGQSIVDPLVRTSQMNAEDTEALDFYADMAFDNFVKSNWDVNVLADSPAAIRKRAYRKMIIGIGSDSDSVDFELTNRVDDFVVKWRGQKAVFFSNGVRVKRDDGCLIFSVE